MFPLSMAKQSLLTLRLEKYTTWTVVGLYSVCQIKLVLSEVKIVLLFSLDLSILSYQSQNGFLVAYQSQNEFSSLNKTHIVIFVVRPSNFFWDVSIHFWKSHRFVFLNSLSNFWKKSFFLHVKSFLVYFNQVYSRIFCHISHTPNQQNIQFFNIWRQFSSK